MGISLWQPVPYDEAELLVREIVADPASRLARAIASTPAPVDPERQKAAEDTMAHYRQMYGL